MFVKQQIDRDFIGFYLVVELEANIKFDASTRISALI